jgi:hypothetical protein
MPDVISESQKRALLISFQQDPTLVPGIDSYHADWPNWLEALIGYEESTLVPFPTGGTVIEMPNTPLKIALAGDWGAQTDAARVVGKIIAEEAPDYSIHLGDVYVSGTHFEHGIFAQQWPTGTLGTFCLDANHDLYSGGAGYLETLANPKFAAQGGQPYFALRNKNWLIVGLDSARASTSMLYQQGWLDPIQLAWLADLIDNKGGRQVILLSHHDAFNPSCLDSTESRRSTAIVYKPLLSQILKLGVTGYWYWAHVHCPVVYAPSQGLSCRCIGHGGVPYQPFPGAPSVYGDEVVTLLWAETEPIAGLDRSAAGFAVLYLDGMTLREQIIDEFGGPVWSDSYVGLTH